MRDGENGGGGGGGMEVGEEAEYIYTIYTYRYTVTTRMTCIKMGSDESHFVSLIEGQSHKTCPQTTT